MQFSTVSRYCYLRPQKKKKHTFKIIINHSVNNTFIVLVICIFKLSFKNVRLLIIHIVDYNVGKIISIPKFNSPT